MTEKRKVKICMDPSGSAWWTGALAGVAALKVWAPCKPEKTEL